MALTKITATNIGANAVTANSIGYAPVNKTGDVMSGTLNVVGGNLRTGYAADVGMVIGNGSAVPNNSVDAHILWGNDTVFGGVNGDLVYVPRTSTGARHRFYTGSGTPVQRMMIDELGRITMPSQPGFHATGTVGGVIVTGNYICPYDTAYYNIGGCYNTSTSRFTAPVAGRYFFYASYLTYSGADQAYQTFTLAVNGTQSYQYGFRRGTNSNQEDRNFSTIISLNVNDYVEARLEANGSNVYFYNSGGHGHFIGQLLG